MHDLLPKLILGEVGVEGLELDTLGGRMRKEAKLLLGKSINSLTLSIEHFNRPWDCDRPEVVLILLDHAFELLLKASILHRSGTIRKPQAKQTIGFEECVRKCLTGKRKFLTDEQVLLLQSINSLRDAAQHHLVDISEQHLYIQAQAGLTLFRTTLADVFADNLRVHLPPRVLPLSIYPPLDLITLFEREVQEIEQLLQPGKRRGIEALAKLRGLAIVDGAMRGEKLQPTDIELRRLGDEIRAKRPWELVFPGVASINITGLGYGPSIDLHVTKNEGLAVHLVPEGTPGAATLAVKRVDELGFYNLGRDQLANKVGLSGPRTTAIIRFLRLQDDPECFKEFTIGKSKHQRYSQKAIAKLTKALAEHSIEDIWRNFGIGQRKGETK
jgi:hypothetical protein